MGLNGLCFDEDPLLFSVESRALKGERRITYWCMSVVFYSLFFLVFLLFFLFIFLSLVFAYFAAILLEVAITILYDCDPNRPPPAVHGKAPFYNARRSQILLF